MRSVVAITILASPCLLALGCGSSSTQGAKGGDGSRFATRFDAAKAITVIAERDAALAKVADDAAAAGDAEMVKKCLREINVESVKDDAAYKSALALGKAGKGNAAIEVAKSIIVVTRRDEALSKLAKGDFGK